MVARTKSFHLPETFRSFFEESNLRWIFRLKNTTRLGLITLRTFKALIPDSETAVRLVSGGKTIGKWCRKREILVLKKPWDLVVRVKDIKRQL
jgi:hypothetical protein